KYFDQDDSDDLSQSLDLSMSNKNDNRTKYCKVCIKELKESDQQPYPYSGAECGTRNLSFHLHEKHSITVQNYQDFIDDNRQTMDFIIHDVQPLHVLQNSEFHRMLHRFQSQYRISSANTVKNYIYDAFVWSKSQFQKLLFSTAISVNLTTDLWTAKNNRGYIEITATWITPNFKLNEALLSY
ncbi:2128_t:CDS:2, partial [Cetraspora pellucida]